MIPEFILEEQIENVVNKKTKEYLKEVVSSYNNGNYRAAVVVLYTLVLYDLMEKLVVLKEIYKDNNAEEILEDIKRQQINCPKRSTWEISLIENIEKKTKLISLVEKEELINLRAERNYAAHPIINIDEDIERLELKQITKETAKYLIRKAFEIVFLRDAILAKKITDDFCNDLKEFYDRAKTDGLESYLNTKYFKRMNQERKDILFRAMWKFSFVSNDDVYKEDRKANYWGLNFLYKENESHYQELLKKDENNYFNKLELETIQEWIDKNTPIRFGTVNIFQNNSRIISLINFIESFPALYKSFNEYAKNILEKSITHMYIRDARNTKLCQIKDKNYEIFQNQLRLQSEAIFLSENKKEHFNMIFKMIDNYMEASYDSRDTTYYNVINSKNLEVIFHQVEYYGCEEEFLEFLIKYCTKACYYWQADVLFESLKQYKTYFKEYHYYQILAGMNKNSQYFGNDSKDSMLEELKGMFTEDFKNDFLVDKEEQYLYDSLYSFDINNNNYNVEKVLDYIEKEGRFQPIYKFKKKLFIFLEHHKSKQNLDFLKLKKPKDYPNIIYILNNKNDSDYHEDYIKEFNEYFV
jgi:hypothetical protein